MHGIAFFLELESRVWQALVDGDAAADETLLDPDFLGVYSTGFAGRDDHAGPLWDGPTVATFTLCQARLLRLGTGRVLLAYRAEFVRAGATAPEAMYVSSIWEEKDGRWYNTFSQDTAEGGPPPV